MRVEDLLPLYEYSYWARDRVLAAAEPLSAEQLDATPLEGLWSLRVIFVHTMSAEWMWRARWEGTSPSTPLKAGDFPTLDAIVARWQAEQQGMRKFIAGLRDEDLAGTVSYTTTRGQAMSDVLGSLMLHVVNHGTQHRSEAAALLTALGRSPGELDLIGFLRARR